MNKQIFTNVQIAIKVTPLNRFVTLSYLMSNVNFNLETFIFAIKMDITFYINSPIILQIVIPYLPFLHRPSLINTVDSYTYADKGHK